MRENAARCFCTFFNGEVWIQRPWVQILWQDKVSCQGCVISRLTLQPCVGCFGGNIVWSQRQWLKGLFWAYPHLPSPSLGDQRTDEKALHQVTPPPLPHNLKTQLGSRDDWAGRQRGIEWAPFSQVAAKYETHLDTWTLEASSLVDIHYVGQDKSYSLSTEITHENKFKVTFKI